MERGAGPVLGGGVSDSSGGGGSGRGGGGGLLDPRIATGTVVPAMGVAAIAIFGPAAVSQVLPAFVVG